MNTMKLSKAIIIFVAFLIVLGGAYYLARPKAASKTSGNANTNSSAQSDSSNTNTVTTPTISSEEQTANLAEKPVATVKTNLGTFKVRFYTTDAPELTKNFIELAKTKYYDGLTFHRIIAGFMIQGGDPKGDGTGGRSYKGEGQGLADEPGALALRHLKGAVAWAKSAQPNSIGSQFYVVLDEAGAASLNGKYSVFGHVVEGQDVVDKIGAVKTANEKPVDPVTIESVTLEQ